MPAVPGLSVASLSAIQQVAWWAALVPAGVLAGRTWFGRSAGVRWWLIVAAFAVSWLADTVAGYVNPWGVSAVYPVLQFGLLYAALARADKALTGLLLVTVAAAGSVALGALYGPGAVLVSVGSLVLFWLAREDQLLGWGLVVYFGLGTVFRVTWPFLVEDALLFQAVWVGYQACRMVGLALVTAALLRDQKVRMYA